MVGDDRARLCGSCDRHVYNIVGLTRGEIESLVESTEGRLCVRMYQRPDATVLTEDCPVGLRLIRKRVATFAGAALSALLGLVSVGFGQDSRDQSRPDVSVERVKIDSGWSEISGFVTDLSGAIVHGAEVSLKGLGFERQTKTDADGKFRFESLPPGLRYELSVQRDGLMKNEFTELDTKSGEAITIEVRLRPRMIHESPLPDETSYGSSAISARRIEPCGLPSPRTERTKIESENGRIVGSITDQMGAVIPGIMVQLFQDETLVTFISSDDTGSFEIKNIKPGKAYVLKMGGHPWKNQSIEKITINAGDRIDYGVCLEVGTETVVVGTLVDAADVRADPTQPSNTIVKRKP